MVIAQLKIWLVLFLPGFGLTFLIAWIPSRRKPNFFKITLWSILIGAVLAAVFVAGLDAFIYYSMRDSVVDHSTVPLSVAQARQQDCPILLPDSAKNVQFVHGSGGMQAMEILVRFEAPVDVCRAEVPIVLQANREQDKSTSPLAQLTPLEITPSPEDHDMVGRAAWFDVEHIRKGSTTGPAKDWEPQIWIDEDRGVFYYKLTD